MKKLFFLFAAVLLSVSCSHTGSTVKYPNMIADMDPYSIGSVNASLDQTFSFQVKSVTAEVFFHPRENEVVLEWNNNMAQYWQFWDEPCRQLFIEALKRYNEDFASQNLTAKYSKSRAIYGKQKGRLHWKTLKISTTYRASPNIEFGYRFRDNAPYFTTNQPEAKVENITDERGVTKSPAIPMYFTRAQAEELAKLFDQAFLLESMEGRETKPPIDDTRDLYIPR